jgi:hypothetical protein
MEETPCDAIIGFAAGCRGKAYGEAQKLREQGQSAILDTTAKSKTELEAYASAQGIKKVIYVDGGAN